MSDLLTEARTARNLPNPVMAREIRRAAGVSRQRLADELNVHVVTVARWERGTRKPRGTHRVDYALILIELQRVSAA